jgi:hypothetical protein
MKVGVNILKSISLTQRGFRITSPISINDATWQPEKVCADLHAHAAQDLTCMLKLLKI